MRVVPSLVAMLDADSGFLASAAQGLEGRAEVLGGNGYIDDYPGVSGGGR